MRGVCFERADMIYESLPTTRLSTRGLTLPTTYPTATARCFAPPKPSPPFPLPTVQDLPSLRDLSPAKLGRFIIGRMNAYAGMRRLSLFIDRRTRAVYVSRNNPSILPPFYRSRRSSYSSDRRPPKPPTILPT